MKSKKQQQKEQERQEQKKKSDRRTMMIVGCVVIAAVAICVVWYLAQNDPNEFKVKVQLDNDGHNHVTGLEYRYTPTGSWTDYPSGGITVEKGGDVYIQVTGSGWIWEDTHNTTSPRLISNVTGNMTLKIENTH